MDLETIRAAPYTPVNPHLDSGGYKPAAVLVAIYGKVPHVIMTEKSGHMRIHAGEISFPGGKPESVDTDLCDTALRETREEIGVTIRRQDVVGQLKPVHTLNSGFWILSFVAVLDKTPETVPNDEVKDILHMPLEPFLDTLKPDAHRGQGMFTLQYRGKTVWGASGRILKHLRDVVA